MRPDAYGPQPTAPTPTGKQSASKAACVAVPNKGTNAVVHQTFAFFEGKWRLVRSAWYRTSEGWVRL